MFNFGSNWLRIAITLRANPRPVARVAHLPRQSTLSVKCHTGPLLSAKPSSFTPSPGLPTRGYVTAKPNRNRTVTGTQLTGDQQPGVEAEDLTDSTSKSATSDIVETIRKNVKGKLYNPVDLATSLDYMNSDVYNNIYRGKPVWFYYRRNFKGHFPPPRTRPNCVVGKKLISSNPCPICRDEYLVLDYRNIKLLAQFINPITSAILETKTTGLCQHQHKKLLLEIEKAQDLGTIEMWLPFHLYNYRDYYSYLDPDTLNQLLEASGYVPPLSEPEATDLTHALSHPSSSTLSELPPALQDMLLRTTNTIPHAREFVPTVAETDWRRPRVPNRYKMEEEHKARLIRQRRSRSLILDS